MANWLDVLMNEDPVGNPKVDLPSENEKEGEKEAAGHEAAGALSEDDDPKGMKTVPAGQDEITGTKSTGYDDFLNFLDKDGEGDACPECGKNPCECDKKEKKDEKKDDKEEGKEEKKDDKGSDDDDASKSAPLKGEPEAGDPDKELKDFLNFLDEDNPGNPKVDLPSENEKEGEKEKSGHEAAGALSEDDDPKGTKNVPAGEDEISGEKSTEFDDFAAIFNKDEDEDPAKEDEEPADDKSEKDDKKEDEEDASKEDKEPTDDEEPVKDFSCFFVDADVEEPDGLPSGSTAKPAEPVDGNGHDVDPIGDPDLPSNLTEPVKVPVSSPAGGKEGELKNAMNVFDEDNSRFFFGDFTF